MYNVRDEMVNDSACGKSKRVESTSLSRCSFRSVRYLEVKICCKHALEPRIVSTVWSLEVFTSWRLPMYYNVLLWDVQSVTRGLSALGSVSASRSVRSDRFDRTW